MPRSATSRVTAVGAGHGARGAGRAGHVAGPAAGRPRPEGVSGRGRHPLKGRERGRGALGRGRGVGGRGREGERARAEHGAVRATAAPLAAGGRGAGRPLLPPGSDLLPAPAGGPAGAAGAQVGARPGPGRGRPVPGLGTHSHLWGTFLPWGSRNPGACLPRPSKVTSHASVLRDHALHPGGARRAPSSGLWVLPRAWPCSGRTPAPSLGGAQPLPHSEKAGSAGVRGSGADEGRSPAFWGREEGMALMGVPAAPRTPAVILVVLISSQDISPAT